MSTLPGVYYVIKAVTDPASGARFITSEFGAGGMGARPGKDGIDAIETDVTNCMNLPAWSIRSGFPDPDQPLAAAARLGGPGEWRGGLGFIRSFEALGPDLETSYPGGAPGRPVGDRDRGRAGYGDLRRRPRDRVRQDVRDRKISRAAARAQYGLDDPAGAPAPDAGTGDATIIG